MGEMPDEIPKEITIQGVLPVVIEHRRELPQWEYVRLPADVPLAVLNEMGRIGWQVTVYISDTNQLLLIREILPSPLPEKDEPAKVDPVNVEPKESPLWPFSAMERPDRFDPDSPEGNASNS